MKERTMLTRLQLRILEFIAERGEIPTPGEIANELGEYIGSISNSLKSLKQNRNVIRQFGEALFKAEQENVFENPESDPRQVRDKTLRMRVKQGYYVARPAYGVKVENGVVYFIPEAVPKIQLAFRLRAKGMTLPEIEEKTEILAYTLQAIFQNPVYAGKVRYKGVVSPGKHEDRAIISEKLFKRAQPPEKGLFINPPPFMKCVHGRFLWKNKKAMKKLNKIFRMRKKRKTFAEIGKKSGFNAVKTRHIIRNPKYAGKKQVNGELVDDPYIDAKIDFDLWQAAQDVTLKDKLAKLRRKQVDENTDKVWKALPGAKRELAKKTDLTIHQIKLPLKRLKPRIVRLQDARWYQKDELTLMLHRMLNKKGWKTLTPITPRGIEIRDKILNILLKYPATEPQISKKVGHHTAHRLKTYKADGIVEKRSDHKYYINEENAKFLRTVQDMLQVIRRQYS